MTSLNPSHSRSPDPEALTITLKFLLWQPLYATEKPFQIFINIPPDAPDVRDTNLVFENVDLPVQDVRLLVPSDSPFSRSKQPAGSDRQSTPLVAPPQDTPIQDVRTLPIPTPLFSLDTPGFMYHTHRTKVACFTDRDLVERNYLPEVEALIREVVEEVDRVVFFDWRVSMMLC